MTKTTLCSIKPVLKGLVIRSKLQRMSRQPVSSHTIDLSSMRRRLTTWRHYFRRRGTRPLCKAMTRLHTALKISSKIAVCATNSPRRHLLLTTAMMPPPSVIWNLNKGNSHKNYHPYFKTNFPK